MCKCGACIAMPTEAECVRYIEIDDIVQKLDENEAVSTAALNTKALNLFA